MAGTAGKWRQEHAGVVGGPGREAAPEPYCLAAVPEPVVWKDY
jgi:hypothetical protein